MTLRDQLNEVNQKINATQAELRFLKALYETLRSQQLQIMERMAKQRDSEV